MFTAKFKNEKYQIKPERCKRDRETKLHAAALNVPKLGSFGFKKITQESVQDSDTYSEASQACTNSSSNVLPENECELDVEISTSAGLTTCTKQAGTESKRHNDEDDSFSLDNDPPVWSETNNDNDDSFSVAPAISIRIELIRDLSPERALAILESEFPDTVASLPSDSTSALPSSPAGCQSPCCTQSRVYQPKSDELKKTSFQQTCPDEKHRQCPISFFFSSMRE